MPTHKDNKGLPFPSAAYTFYLEYS